MNIKSKLIALDNILLSQGAPVCKYLNIGAKEPIINDFISSEEIARNLKFIQLYKWHNGINFPQSGVPSSHIELLPFGALFSLSFISEMRKELTGWEIMDNANMFIPFLGSGEDDMYLLKNDTQGMVYFLSPAANVYGDPCFKSIEGLIDFMIDCYNERILINDTIEGLVVDSQKYWPKWKANQNNLTGGNFY
jgi:hypothetical protein